MKTRVGSTLGVKGCVAVAVEVFAGGKLGVGVGVFVGVKVRVRVDVIVEVGVRVGPKIFPGPQAEKVKLAKRKSRAGFYGSSSYHRTAFILPCHQPNRAGEDCSSPA